MAETIPLFPLGKVLFPGLVLPLHVFEERYRLLVRRLIDRPTGSPRRFGVVAIREGREVGADAVRSLHDVGCLAELGQVEEFEDGRFDIVSLGTERFRLLGVDDSLPYLQGEVEMLPESPGDADVIMADAVRRAFARYRASLTAVRGDAAPPELPADPSTLSYFVAAATTLELGDKQRLLAADDDGTRLRRELDLLRREIGVLTAVPSLPATDLARSAYSTN